MYKKIFIALSSSIKKMKGYKYSISIYTKKEKQSKVRWELKQYKRHGEMSKYKI